MGDLEKGKDPILKYVCNKLLKIMDELSCYEKSINQSEYIG